MKKIIVFALVGLFVLFAGCSDKNVLFKDDIYTITKGDDGVVVSVNEGAHVPEIHYTAEAYIDIASLPCLSVVEHKDNILTVSSYNYDRDAKDNFKLWQIAAAEDITFNSIMVLDKNGKVTVTEEEILSDDKEYVGTYYSCGYFDFNDKGEVSHITFYGEVVIQD